MRDVLPTLERWVAEGRRFATATVTHTWGSSPRPVGAVMGVREDGLTCGSVSGGCVESAVIEESLAALRSGQPQILTFSEISQETAWGVGLSCGGKIQVWIEPEPADANPELWRTVADRINADLPTVAVTRYSPFGKELWLPDRTDGSALADAIDSAYRSRKSGEVEVDGERYFLHVLAHRERLLIVGAVHIAIPLIAFAKELGFETVVVDPRGAFAKEERFSSPPDQILAEWPEKAFSGLGLTGDTYAVLLTHDPKIDDVALALLLRSPVAYIGALGSRTTQAKRRHDLIGQGFSEEDLSRVHGPVGLDIGARTPEEIALSIMAEIVKVRRGRG